MYGATNRHVKSYLKKEKLHLSFYYFMQGRAGVLAGTAGPEVISRFFQVLAGNCCLVETLAEICGGQKN